MQALQQLTGLEGLYELKNGSTDTRAEDHKTLYKTRTWELSRVMCSTLSFFLLQNKYTEQ